MTKQSSPVELRRASLEQVLRQRVFETERNWQEKDGEMVFSLHTNLRGMEPNAYLIEDALRAILQEVGLNYRPQYNRRPLEMDDCRAIVTTSKNPLGPAPKYTINVHVTPERYKKTIAPMIESASGRSNLDVLRQAKNTMHLPAVTPNTLAQQLLETYLFRDSHAWQMEEGALVFHRDAPLQHAVFKANTTDWLRDQIDRLFANCNSSVKVGFTAPSSNAQEGLEHLSLRVTHPHGIDALTKYMSQRGDSYVRSLQDARGR